ncbi:MAG: tRNA lysidine(34) synthetase TilS [Acidobacteria bacterium]|nr:tRNA lysidine(34) synthetase TilS [Acidobacteriota bacterium]
MHQFVRKLITEWRRLELPISSGTFVIAVSGGADSVSLLLGVHDLVIRKKLALRVVAAHFNHKLRGSESDRDEEYVRSLCTRLAIELAVGHGSLPKDGNLEQNARDARYKFLSETAANLDSFAVLTAHTVNDQAETFLLNLVRGSGPDGLSGMKPVRSLDGDIKLVRPLLMWAKRKETEGFCRDLGVDYCYDTMNEDTAFKRVRIRKILLPLLEDMNPNIIETLANTASLMQNLPAAAMAQPPDDLDLATIRDLGESELYSTLRDWLQQKRGSTRALQLKHIKSIERLVHSEKSGRVAELPGGARVVKSGGRLRYEENGVDN